MGNSKDRESDVKGIWVRICITVVCLLQSDLVLAQLSMYNLQRLKFFYIITSLICTYDLTILTTILNRHCNKFPAPNPFFPTGWLFPSFSCFHKYSLLLSGCVHHEENEANTKFNILKDDIVSTVVKKHYS